MWESLPSMRMGPGERIMIAGRGRTKPTNGEGEIEGPDGTVVSFVALDNLAYPLTRNFSVSSFCFRVRCRRPWLKN